METQSRAHAIFAEMKPLNAQDAFREALLDFVDEPTMRNARRYLAASRLLADATGRPSKPKRTRKRSSSAPVSVPARTS